MSRASGPGPENAVPPESPFGVFARRFMGILILVIGLALVAGSAAVILGLVGEAPSPWRQVFRAMGSALAAVASAAFALGGVALVTGDPRLGMFTAWAGVQGTAMAMGCLIASLLLEGSRQLALAGVGALIGLAAAYALSRTVFRRARAGPASAERRIP